MSIFLSSRQFAWFYFMFLLALQDIFLAMIGCCDCIGFHFSFTTTNWKSPYILNLTITYIVGARSQRIFCWLVFTMNLGWSIKIRQGKLNYLIPCIFLWSQWSPCTISAWQSQPVISWYSQVKWCGRNDNNFISFNLLLM